MLKCDQGFKDKATTTSVGRHWDGLMKTRAGLIKIIVIMVYFDCVSKDVTSEEKGSYLFFTEDQSSIERLQISFFL